MIEVAMMLFIVFVMLVLIIPLALFGDGAS